MSQFEMDLIRLLINYEPKAEIEAFKVLTFQKVIIYAPNVLKV